MTTIRHTLASLLQVAAFISVGMHADIKALDKAKKPLGVGDDGFTAAGIHYTEYCEDLFQAADGAGFEVPGVFLYEVAEEFGRWYVQNVSVVDAILPNHEAACNHLLQLTIDFFNRGELDKGPAARLEAALAAVAMPSAPQI